LFSDFAISARAGSILGEHLLPQLFGVSIVASIKQSLAAKTQRW